MPFVLWLTGLPCSGKTTLARVLGSMLRASGHPVEILDGDSLRRTRNADLGFSKSDRCEQVKRIGCLCQDIVANGRIPIVAAISPYRESRQMVRAALSRFVEIYVRAPLDLCIMRDVKGLYAKALRGQLQGFTGIDDPYEEPLCAEITLDTDIYTVEECCNKVARWLSNGNLQSSSSLKFVTNKTPTGILDQVSEAFLSS